VLDFFHSSKVGILACLLVSFDVIPGGFGAGRDGLGLGFGGSFRLVYK